MGPFKYFEVWVGTPSDFDEFFPVYMGIYYAKNFKEACDKTARVKHWGDEYNSDNLTYNTIRLFPSLEKAVLNYTSKWKYDKDCKRKQESTECYSNYIQRYKI